MLEQAFLKQAKSCEMLGSPFTARLLRVIAEHAPDHGAVWSRIHNWPGDVTATGDAVALRLAGALHGLVIEGRSDTLSAIYPPKTAPEYDADFWEILSGEITRSENYILERLNRPPQTNEIGRSSAILFGASAAVKRTGLDRLMTFEVGASAGLNMHWDQFSYQLGGCDWGHKEARVHLEPDWQGDRPDLSSFTVTGRSGCDLTPLDIRAAEEEIRLLSYIWPDQNLRLSRAKAAIEIFKGSNTTVEKADAVSWLQSRLMDAPDGVLRLVYHTVVAQYFPQEVRAAFEGVLKAAGERATKESPLAWLSMETDGGIEGALLRLTVWPAGEVIDLARVDFHGRWVKPIN